MKVLVADDDKSMRDLIARLLAIVGVPDVATAQDGDEAWGRFEREQFDLVVTDWEMPGINGVELVRAIRAAGSQVPVIMVTVRAQRDQVVEAIQAGVSDFLAKPFRADVLREKLGRFCQHIAVLKQFKARTGASMRVDYINPFITSVISLFDTMMGIEVVRGEPFANDGALPEHDLSGVVTLSGKAQGTVALSLGEATAQRAAATLLGEPPAGLDDLIDAVGEMTNIVAGGAKGQLEPLAMRISLPSVIWGKERAIEFPADASPICIPFECPWGPVTLQVGLVETKDLKSPAREASHAGI